MAIHPEKTIARARRHIYGVNNILIDARNAITREQFSDAIAHLVRARDELQRAIDVIAEERGSPHES